MVDDERGLKDQAISGLAWKFGSLGVGTVWQLGIGVILARLLTPAEFGLFGLALIVTGFCGLFSELGLGPALIQRNEITPFHVRVAFTVSTAMGVSLGALVYAGAPFAAEFLHDGRVAGVLEVLSLSFFLSALAVVSKALITRDLGFKRLFYIELIGAVAWGVTAVVMAVRGFGVRSLVYPTVFQAGLISVISYGLCRHPISPLIRRREFKELFNFGAGMSLASVFNFFALQGDYFVVGRMLGLGPLGIYTRAYSLMTIPTTKLVQGVGSVLFPAASRLQDRPSLLGKAYRFVLSVMGFLTIPLMVSIVILAPEIIRGVYGDQWTEAIVPLQILGCFGVFRALYSGTADFVRARGWVYRMLACQIVYAACVFGGAWVAARHWGINGVAWAVGLSIGIMWFLTGYFGNRATETSYSSWLATLQPGAVLGAVVGSACAGAKALLLPLGLPDLLVLGVCLAAGLAAAMGAVRYLPQRWLRHLPLRVLREIGPLLPGALHGHAGAYADKLSADAIRSRASW